MESTNQSLVIRDARPEDAPALSGLLEELEFPAPTSVIAERLRAMTRAGEVVLVAVEGERLIGLLTIHVMPVLHRPTPVGRLSALVVTAEARGRGVGHALVAAAEQTLAARGCGLVEVTSNLKRTDAHVFYERLGYEVTSFRFKKTLTPVS